MPDRWLVTAKCEDCGDEQEIHYEGGDRKAVELFAGLMDGTAFPVEPGVESEIGRCGKCRGRFKCSVTEEPPP